MITHSLKTLAVLVFILCASGSSAYAATFCIVGNGLQPQCLYDDADECNKNAQSPSFVCTVNDEVELSYIGRLRYCIVDSNRVAQCLYEDHDRCNNDARRRHFVCIERRKAGSDDINPYRYDPRSQN